MHNIEKLKSMLCDELDRIAGKGELTSSTLETVHKLTDTIKNIDKIIMLDEVSAIGEYSERKSYYRGSSYRDGDAYYARQKRDSLGRYASDDGLSYRGRGYSRAEAKSHIAQQIEDLMADAQSEKERQVLQKAMSALENA